jgi:hypothetical protein
MHQIKITQMYSLITMKTTSLNSSLLLKNNTKLLSVYNRINFRFIGCMVLLGEPLIGFRFADR